MPTAEEQYFYSASQNGFYVSTIHTTYPEDAVEISLTHHQSLLNAQQQGLTIGADEQGLPIARDIPASQEMLINEAKQYQQRLRHIANEKIQVLQDALELGLATDAEKQLLIEWKKYRVLLHRVEEQNLNVKDYPTPPNENVMTDDKS